jgi:hypothetical protein
MNNILSLIAFINLISPILSIPRPDLISSVFSDPNSSEEDKKKNDLMSRPIIINISDKAETNQYAPPPRQQTPMEQQQPQPQRYYPQAYQPSYGQYQPTYSQYQPYQNYFRPNEYYSGYGHNRPYQEAQNEIDGYYN